VKGFEKLKREVIDCDLCTGCGTCIGVCPVHTLAYENGRVVDAGKRCVQCGRCSAVCPGKEFPMDEWSQELFQKKYDSRKLFGTYQGIYNAYAVKDEIRVTGSSGGVVTQILIDLLRLHIIDGAVAVREKKEEPYRFASFIAVSEEEIIRAAQSKYVVIPVNQVIREIERTGKKVAYVGLPCQIQGMRKAMKVNPRLADQVAVLISLFCGFNMEERATEYLIKKGGFQKPEVEKLSYRHKKDRETGFYIRGKDGREFFVNKHGYTFMNLLFSPRRCWKCYDYSGEFADLSVGDAWEKGPGFSRVIVRTQRGNDIFEKLRDIGSIYAKPCDEGAIIKTQQKVVSYKKRQIAVRKKRMKAFPDYGVEPEPCRGKLWIKGIILYWILCFFQNPVGRFSIRFLPFRLLVRISERLKGREVIRDENESYL